MEKIKENSIKAFPPNFMFWKYKFGPKVDFVEYKDGEISAFECKWSKSDNYLFKEFIRRYSKAKTEVVSPEYFLKDDIC